MRNRGGLAGRQSTVSPRPHCVEEIVSSHPRVLVAIFAIVLSAFAAPSAGAQTAPSLRIVPNPTTAGQTVAAFGTDFCGTPSCPPVLLTVDGRIAATASVEPTGSFSTSFKAPTIPNQYVVTVDQAGDPPMRATSGFLVTASDTPPPTSPSGTSNSTTTVSGRPPKVSSSTEPASSPTSTRKSAAGHKTGSGGTGTGRSVLLAIVASAMAATVAGFWFRRRRRRP